MKDTEVYAGFNRVLIKKNTPLTVRKCYGECVFFNEVVNILQKGFFAKSDNYEAAYNVDKFAPIESQFQSITFKEVVEIESPLISVQ